MSRAFHLVDVFGSGPFSGNPLAVVSAAEGLSAEEMLAITRWLNLSETTFLLPASDSAADYHVRIFTPGGELPFAGHPTLGTAHVWLETGGVPRTPGTVVQQCGVGLVRVAREEDGRLAFAAPPLIRSGTPDQAEIDEALQVLNLPQASIVEAQWVDNGPGWLAVMLESAEAVLAVRPAGSHTRTIDIGVVGPHAPGGEVQWEVRGLFTDATLALREDPVTGSLNASLGQWLFASGRAQGAYVAAQGTCLGRQGRVFVQQDDDGQVWVAGQTSTRFTGNMS